MLDAILVSGEAFRVGVGLANNMAGLGGALRFRQPGGGRRVRYPSEAIADEICGLCYNAHRSIGLRVLVERRATWMAMGR